MKKILIIIGSVLLVALVAAGSFWGGMQYQDNLTAQTRQDFITARGLNNDAAPGFGPQSGANGQTPFGSQAPGDRRGRFIGGGTFGTIKSIDGNVVTLSTAQDVTAVTFTSDTNIQMTVSGAISDLKPGMRILVAGKTDKNGAINADQVTILSEDGSFPTNPPQQGGTP